MIPNVSMETYVTPRKENCIKMHLTVFDKNKLKDIGNVGETYACDIVVPINPTNLRSSPNQLSRTQNINSSLNWSGDMRLHKNGVTLTSLNQKDHIVKFNSDDFKADKIGPHLTRTAVSSTVDRTKKNMENLQEALLMYRGASESHKEIPPLIAVMRPHIGRNLTPRELTTMTEQKALAWAHRALTMQTLNHDDAELKVGLRNSIPKKYHNGRLSVKPERREEQFGKATALTMTAAIKTARTLYCIEEAYIDLKSRLEQPRTPRLGNSLSQAA